jgi:hypothetical protein
MVFEPGRRDWPKCPLADMQRNGRFGNPTYAELLTNHVCEVQASSRRRDRAKLIWIGKGGAIPTAIV